MKQRQEHKENVSNRILEENPYDIETFLESMRIALNSEKEYLFMDKFISGIRKDSKVETTDLCYKILRDLKAIDIE